jgi:hypothetical protein
VREPPVERIVDPHAADERLRRGAQLELGDHVLGDGARLGDLEVRRDARLGQVLADQ